MPSIIKVSMSYTDFTGSTAGTTWAQEDESVAAANATTAITGLTPLLMTARVAVDGLVYPSPDPATVVLSGEQVTFVDANGAAHRWWIPGILAAYVLPTGLLDTSAPAVSNWIATWLAHVRTEGGISLVGYQGSKASWQRSYPYPHR